MARIINSTRVSEPSYSRFTSRRFETKNSSDHFTRNSFRERDVTGSLNRNFGKSFGTKNSSDHVTRNSFRGRDVTNFSGRKHNVKAAGGSRQHDLYNGKGNVTQNSFQGKDVTNSINRNFGKIFDGKDAKARSQAISKWIEELHN